MKNEKQIAGAFLLFAVMGNISLAQQPGLQLPAILEQWPSKGTASGGFTQVISPDGTMRVHLGPLEESDGLYIKNRLTGQDTLIVESAEKYKEFDSMSFSNDGSLIAFRACPPLGAACSWSKVFTVHSDGTQLIEVADSFSDKASDTVYSVGAPLISPDNSKTLVTMRVMEMIKFDGVGQRRVLTSYYIGMVPADGSNKTPEKLISGKALFWSQDGTAFYYNGQSGLSRYDVQGKSSVPISLPQGESRILGKMPGEDVVFVESAQGSSISAFSLTGGEIAEKIQQFVATIPTKDAENRPLSSIDNAGPQRLLLRYSSKHAKPGIAKQNNELVSFQ